MKVNTELVPARVEETISRLQMRITERFPESSLVQNCQTLYQMSLETNRIVRWIRRPLYVLRAVTYILILVLGIMLVVSIDRLNIETGEWGIPELVGVTEAGLNTIVLVGIGLFFLITLETRRKRNRVTSAIHKLRSMAHIIDAHQLTKDPDQSRAAPTSASPRHGLTDFELGRYLDYCSEMLSLIGKVAFLYVQHFDDPVASNAANDLETLTTGLSRKIWQKIMVLRSLSVTDPTP